MNIDYNKYIDFYNDNFEKIHRAHICIINNPCKNVASKIDFFIEFLEEKKSISWEGDGREEFDANIDAGLTNLNNIKDSINTIWQDSENIYLKIFSELESLKKAYTTLKTTIIDDEPKLSNFAHYDRNEEGKVIRITYPGYGDAKNEWKKRCEILNLACLNICSTIDDLFAQLKANDAAVITLVYSPFSKGRVHLEELVVNGYAITDPAIIAQLLGMQSSPSDVSLINYSRDKEMGLLNIRFNQTTGSWEYGDWSTRVHGVDLADSGCSIMSMASVLTTIYSKEYEQDVIITPLMVANSLENTNDLSNQFSPGSGFKSFAGSTMGRDITSTFDVVIFENHDYKKEGSGSISETELRSVAANNGCVVGSLKNEGHLVAVTGFSKDGKEYLADTGSGDHRLIQGTDKVTQFKYHALVFPSEAVEVNNGKVLLNGSEQFNVGSVSRLAVNGVTYPVKRVPVENNNNMFEYHIVEA